MKKWKLIAGLAVVAALVIAPTAAMADEASPPGDVVVVEPTTPAPEPVVAEPAPVPVADPPAAVVDDPVPVADPPAPVVDEQPTVSTQGGYEHPKKVYVCKYVGTPGKDEVLKDGKNPIEVSVNTLKDFPGTFPWEFADAQGRSIAVGFVEYGYWPDCPPPDNNPCWFGDSGGPEDCLVTPELTWTPPSCDEDGTLWMTDDPRIAWSAVLNDDGSTTYTATIVQNGDVGYYNFPPDAQTEWTVPSLKQLPEDSDECALVTPVPTLFAAEPTPPTCDTDGALPNLEGDVAEIVIGHVDLYFDRPYDGPGTYTLNADALDGYTFEDGTTHKEREIVVQGAIGFQSTDPEAPCFLAAPLETTLATPTIDDQCGTENDFAFLPTSTDSVFYGWADLDDPDNFDVLATVAEGFTVTGDTTGWVDNGNGTWTYAWDPVFTDVACPDVPNEPPAPPTKVTTPPALASTGGGDVSPILPIGAGIATMAGLALLVGRRLVRR